MLDIANPHGRPHSGGQPVGLPTRSIRPKGQPPCRGQCRQVGHCLRTVARHFDGAQPNPAEGDCHQSGDQ
jgi:hypothetical protein